MAQNRTLKLSRIHLGSERFAGRRLMILLAVIPVLLFIGLWSFVPIIYSLVMSFFEWNPLAIQTKFLGLANYIYAFTQDPLFWLSLRNTLYYMLITVPLGIFLSLMVALLINSLPKLVGFYRVIYFIPVVTSMVAVAIVWRWLYQTQFDSRHLDPLGEVHTDEPIPEATELEDVVLA
jgi:multiple sugar transport system permease protein